MSWDPLPFSKYSQHIKQEAYNLWWNQSYFETKLPQALIKPKKNNKQIYLTQQTIKDHLHKKSLEDHTVPCSDKSFKDLEIKCLVTTDQASYVHVCLPSLAVLTTGVSMWAPQILQGPSSVLTCSYPSTVYNNYGIYLSFEALAWAEPGWAKLWFRAQCWAHILARPSPPQAKPKPWLWGQAEPNTIHHCETHSVDKGI